MYSRGKAWAVTGVIAAVCLALGWGLGTWTVCGDRCKYDAETFGALGTWFGAIGTILAVVFAARSFTAETRARERQEAKEVQAQEKVDRERRNDAEKVQAYVAPGSWGAVDSQGNRPLKTFTVGVWNEAHTASALKVDLDLEGYSAVQIDEVPPNGFEKTSGVVSNWERPAGTEDDEALAMTDVAVLTFTMHGIRWTRTGRGPVEGVGE